jgi:hypothetical protein
MVLPMPLKLVTLPTFKTWWTKHWSWKTKEESWNEKEKCNALDLKEATQGSVLVLPHRDLISTHVSRVGSREYKLQVKDFRLCHGRFNAPIFSLLALHHHHHKGIVMHRILVLWDRATVGVRLSTILIGVP